VTDLYDIAAAQRSHQDEKVCGDAYVVLPCEGGTLVALADGLGHGPQAAEAALLFCDHVRAAQSSSLVDLMHGAHELLERTRGVAAGLLHLDPAKRRLAYAGVGNIEFAAVSREPIRPLCTPGIVGKRMRKVTPYQYKYHGGDVLMLFSDGISSHCAITPYLHLGAQAIADAILIHHGKAHDDATCIVVRCR